MSRNGFLLLAILLLSMSSTFAGTVERVLPLDDLWNTPGADAARLLTVLDDPATDRYSLPSVSWWWALEDGQSIVSAEIVIMDERQESRLSREPQRIPLESNEGGATLPAEGPLWTDQYKVSVSGTNILHGRRYQVLNLYPLRAVDGQILSLREAKLRIEIADGETAYDAARPLRDSFPLRERSLGLIGNRLLNPEALPADSGRAVGGSGFPTDAPSIDGSEVEMVIVTVDSFMDLCETYASQKTDWGIPTVARSMSWIASHYPYGSDRPEMIRNFILDAYEKWSIKYVLIVGDTDQVPVRYAYSTLFVDPVTTPTDLYYGCLDGNWNADLDSHFCEVADNGDPGDEADLIPEVFVGRFPAGNYSEAETMLSKMQNTQSCVETDYQNRVLLLGEVLFPQEWNFGDTIHIDGADYCEFVRTGGAGPDQELTRLYENYYAFPGSDPLSRAATMDEFDAGPSVVLHNGHGGRQNMSVGDQSITSSDVETLFNEDRYFMLYMVNCTAAAFDFNSLAEAFLQNSFGGTYGVIGSTRETFSNISVNYQNVFFFALYADPTQRLGDLYANSLIAFDIEAQEDSGYRWAHQTFALLGDPSAWVRYQLPESASVSYNSSYEAGSGPLTITVQDGNLEAWENITVAIRKGDEDYQRGVTDALGEVTFNPLPETSGIYQVRVDPRDGIPWQGLLSVSMPGAAEYLSLESVLVEDTSDGTVIGNGNGLPEAGETVRLSLPLQNEGSVTATGISAVLSSSHPGVTLLDDNDVYDDIDSGQGGQGGDGYLLELAFFGDDEILPFELTITSAAGVQVDEFFLETAARDLQLFRTDLDDSSGGDGDGEIELGETAQVALSVINRGRGMAPDVTASLAPKPPSGLSIISGDVSLGDLSGLGGEEGPAVFTVERISISAPQLYMFLTDANGVVDTLEVLLERPDATVEAPTFEFTTQVTVLHLNWEPASGAVAGYRVMRSSVSESGPYEEVTPDWTTSSTFEDTTLEPLSVFWYQIVPLSESLLEGEPSLAASVTTNPALKAGWPKELEWSTPCSALALDLDDDGTLEILVGNKELNGFFHDGRELSDGDFDSETIGPVSYLGEKYDAALSAGDVIPGDGLEVVGASWNTGEIYVWEFTSGLGTISATVADGWPQDVLASTGIWASPSLGDVDGDGDLEIFVVDVSGALLGWHHDGSEVVDGDSNPGTHGVFDTGLGVWPRGTPSFADINNDGSLEIFVPAQNGELRGYWGNGNNLPGFPFDHGGEMYGSCAIGDLDLDGLPEIVFHTSADSLYVISHQGDRHPGWPIKLDYDNYNYWMAPSPALADVAGDAAPEIFITSMIDHDDVEVGFLDITGAWLPGWPVLVHQVSQSSPVVVDLDGDLDYEVILTNEGGEIQVWHHDGEPMAGFPIILGEAARATPTIADVDDDGLLDMIYAGWDTYLYVWEFPQGNADQNYAWYTFQHDQLRTGWTRSHDWIIGELVGVDEGELPAGAVLLDGVWPNPFNPSTSIRFTLGEGPAREVELGIYDAQGRRLAQLAEGPMEPGTYLTNWNGRDDRGREMPSGIYFARLRVDDRVESKKMTLLK